MAQDPELLARPPVDPEIKAEIDAMDLAQLANHYKHNMGHSALLRGPAFDYFMARFKVLSVTSAPEWDR